VFRGTYFFWKKTVGLRGEFYGPVTGFKLLDIDGVKFVKMVFL